MSTASSGSKKLKLINPKIGIIIPTLLEQKCLSRRGPNIGYQVISGMGKVNAALSAARAILYEECDVVLLVGFCGGIANVAIGDIVYPEQVIEADFNAGSLEPKTRIADIENVIGMPAKSAKFFTMDRFLTSRDEPQVKLAEAAGGASVVEMEAWGVLQACIRFGAKFACIRVVSDIVGSNTETDFLTACKKLDPILNEAVEKTTEAIRKAYAD